jgi:heme-degrading monooxygenase HmoA
LIRSVATIRFRPGVSDEQIDAFARAVLSLEIDGLTSCTLGRDVGLRESAADYAIVLDFDDEQAYRRYDNAPDHAALRSGLAAEIVESASLCQFRVA